MNISTQWSQCGKTSANRLEIVLRHQPKLVDAGCLRLFWFCQQSTQKLQAMRKACQDLLNNDFATLFLLWRVEYWRANRSSCGAEHPAACFYLSTADTPSRTPFAVQRLTWIRHLNPRVLDLRMAVLDQNPLGSAAGFGINGLQLDRGETAKLMGFAGVQHNPMRPGATGPSECVRIRTEVNGSEWK